MTDRTVDEAIALIKSVIGGENEIMSLKLGTLREMVNEITTLRNRRSAKSYDEGYQCGWIEAKSDYKERLRDEFAMAALQGIIPCYGINYDNKTKTTAKNAYLLADAMMEARKK